MQRGAIDFSWKYSVLSGEDSQLNVAVLLGFVGLLVS